jgi:hypothetical protein
MLISGHILRYDDVHEHQNAPPIRMSRRWYEEVEQDEAYDSVHETDSEEEHDPTDDEPNKPKVEAERWEN